MAGSEVTCAQALQERLVSVIVATHNRASLLSEAMKSVFAQSHRPIELIVANDGSTDNTEETIDAFCARHAYDGGFTCIPLLQQRQGPVIARNNAVRVSRGSFIQFLDDDDALHPEKLKKQVSTLLSESDVDVIVSQTIFCNERMEVNSVSAVLNEERQPDMVAFFLNLSHDISNHAPLYRRAAIEAVGGWDERVAHGDEVDLHIRMAIAGVRFKFTKDQLAYVRSHRGAGRRTIFERITPAAVERDFYWRIIDFSERRRESRDDALRARVAQRLLGIGRRHYASFRPGIAHGCLAAARDICPEYSSFRLKVYSGPAGDMVGTLIESCSSFAMRIARLGVRSLNGPWKSLTMEQGERGRFGVSRH